MVLAHALYFAVPLLFWLVLRAIEPQRVFSRLYLAIALALVYFPSELLTGIGLWMTWLAYCAVPTRTNRAIVIATLLFATAIAFTHPSTALMSLLLAVIGGALIYAGRAFPVRLAIAAVAMAILLIGAYEITNVLLPTRNPTISAALAANRFDYINPVWMLATLAMFPVLAALWLLMLSAGTVSARLRWRLSALGVVSIAVVGTWFAANGTSQHTWLYARHSGVHVLTLAVALALVAPAVWVVRARLALTLYAMVVVVGFVSYNVDLFIFGRFVDTHLARGIVDVDARAPGSESWPPRREATFGRRVYFKWAAGNDYARDVVVPDYDWYRVTLAFYSYFRSARTGILFHRVDPAVDWVPFECSAVERALGRARDEKDRMFLAFVRENYCV